MAVRPRSLRAKIAGSMPESVAPEPETNATPEYLSVAQVARRLGCSVSLVQKWRRLGWLPATRLGTPDVAVYGYLPEDIDRFVQERWNRRRGRPPGSSSTRAPSRPSTFLPIRTTAAGPRPGTHSETPTPPRSVAAPPATSRATPPPAPAPTPTPALTGRPLVLWDDDPRSGTPLVLARFAAGEIDQALAIAESWSRRYPTLALGELPPPGAARDGSATAVLAVWRSGIRQ